MKNVQQGRYTLKNPKKYKGDPNNVIFRSSWEKRFMIFCDTHPSVIQWASEEIAIPYYWELDGKNHRYFPDFIVLMQTTKGNVVMMVEVKPYVQTIKPERTKRKREKTFITEVETYSKNVAKWKAAEQFCKQRGWQFRLITEKDLFKDKVW